MFLEVILYCLRVITPLEKPVMIDGWFGIFKINESSRIEDLDYLWNFLLLLILVVEDSKVFLVVSEPQNTLIIISRWIVSYSQSQQIFKR